MIDALTVVFIGHPSSLPGALCGYKYIISIFELFSEGRCEETDCRAFICSYRLKITCLIPHDISSSKLVLEKYKHKDVFMRVNT